ncbi:MAG TPA: hypothetical protein VK524_34295, partial [Polyangiaceae bacterium]|nr:hypothetical protein [Polyangiaceae bacterium]
EADLAAAREDVEIEEREIEVPALDREALAKLSGEVHRLLSDVETEVQTAQEALDVLFKNAVDEHEFCFSDGSTLDEVKRKQSPAPAPRAPALPRKTLPATNGDFVEHTHLPKVERLILTTLAQQRPRQVSRERLALLIGYHQNSKGFANALGALRSRAAIEGTTITDKGFCELGTFEPLPTGRELLEWYCEHKLNTAESGILREIAHLRGKITRDELAARVGYHPNSKSFANGLGRLRGLGLVDGLKLSPDLEDR